MYPIEIISSLHTLISIKQPVFLWGAPGIGKSQIVSQVAKERNLELIDIRAVLLDPVDLRGLPHINKDGLAAWSPPSFLPKQESGGEGLLFLDELNSAPPLVQAACYQLVLDRRIGDYFLPDGWTVIAAGNGEKDRSVTHRMPTALANRMVHLEMETSLDDWLLWAQKNNISSEIIAFLRFRPKLLHDFDPVNSSKAFASPRSWYFLSQILHTKPEKSIELELFKGTIGAIAATEFMGFLEIWRDLPKTEDIFSNPNNATVPDEPATLYALCELLGSKANANNIENLILYSARMPVEFSVLLMRTAVCHDESIVKTKSFENWAQQHAHVLM